MYIRTLTQKCGIAVCEIIKNPNKYPLISKYPKSTIYRHAKKSLDKIAVDGRRENTGRPRKSNERIKRIIKREITQMRISNGTFSSAELQTSCGLTNISNSTFRRVLKQMGYNWRNTRRKGKVLKSDDDTFSDGDSDYEPEDSDSDDSDSENIEPMVHPKGFKDFSGNSLKILKKYKKYLHSEYCAKEKVSDEFEALVKILRACSCTEEIKYLFQKKVFNRGFLKIFRLKSSGKQFGEPKKDSAMKTNTVYLDNFCSFLKKDKIYEEEKYLITRFKNPQEQLS